ncbi:MAG: hypothetical protein ACKVUS_01915 [Saprospiraceae bacterium]
MIFFRIYKEIEVSYREFATLLRKLGFRDESVGDRFRFVSDAHNSIVLLHKPSSQDDKVLKGDFAGYSYALSEQGVINEPDDLAKMIEAERLALTASAA